MKSAIAGTIALMGILLVAQPSFALQDYSATQAAGLSFLQNNLQDATGGIYANLLEIYPENNNAGVNHQMLSEYSGISMEFAAYADNPSFFETQHSFVSNVLLDPRSGLYNWRVDKNGNELTTSSASLDDFRIINGYLLAADQWDNETYRTEGLEIAEALRVYAIADGIMTQGATWNDFGVYTTDSAIIAYLDLPTMKRIAKHDTRWIQIEAAQHDLVQGAAIGNGLYWQDYDLQTGLYDTGATTVNSIHQGIIAMHLAGAGYADEAQVSLDFFKGKYEEYGRIAGVYYPQSGEEAVDFQDTSVYAFVAALAIYQGDEIFAETILDLLESLQIESNNEYNGAFLWSKPNPSRVYAFGHTAILRSLALPEWIERQAEVAPPETTPPTTSDPPANIKTDPIEEGGKITTPPKNSIEPVNEDDQAAPANEDLGSPEKNEGDQAGITTTKKTKSKWQRKQRRLLVKCMDNPSKKKLKRWKKKIHVAGKYKKAHKRHAKCLKKAKRTTKKIRLAAKKTRNAK